MWGFKLNYGVCVGQLTWGHLSLINYGTYVGPFTWGFYFIVGEEGYEFLFYSRGFDELN